MVRFDRVVCRWLSVGWCGVTDAASKAVFARTGNVFRIAHITVDILVWLTWYKIVWWRRVVRISSNMRISSSALFGRIIVLLIVGHIGVLPSGSPGQEGLHKRDVSLERGRRRISQWLGSSSRCDVLLRFGW